MRIPSSPLPRPVGRQPERCTDHVLGSLDAGPSVVRDVLSNPPEGAVLR
jgi:hypothetical protein